MTWRALDKSWHDTDVEYCDVCGNLLIQRAWVFRTPEGEELRACREDDERLHARLRTFAPRVDEARREFDARTTGGTER